jgi:hypothetical protein
MRIPFLGLVLLGGQLITMQSRPVTHLQPHKNMIEPGFGGSLVELMNAPVVIYLPPSPPKEDAQGVPWSVDVKNLGPVSVMITSTKSHFQTVVGIGQTVHIDSNGVTYLLKR